MQEFLLQLYGGAAAEDDASHDPARGAGAGAAARRRGARGAAQRRPGEPGGDPGAAARRQARPAGDRRPTTPRRRWRCTRPSAPATSPPATGRSRRSSRRSSLDEVPLRIECYDVSNLQGTEVVASMVVFEDGLSAQGGVPPLRHPRRRRARTTSPNARGHHPAVPAAARRAGPRRDGEHRLRADARRPRDRTTAQVRLRARRSSSSTAARRRSRPPSRRSPSSAINDIPVCGLAKRLEEVWLPDEEDPVIMARTSEGLYLLQRVRDEAHRFAITHHRSRRSKTMVESVLDDVPGLGEVRRKTLLKHFGSLKKLREADADQIALVPGIGPRTAASIKEAVAEADATRKTGTAPADQHRHGRDRGGLGWIEATPGRAGHRHRHDRAPAAARRPRSWRTSATSWSTTCRRRWCATSYASSTTAAASTSRSPWWSTSAPARSSTPCRPTGTRA